MKVVYFSEDGFINHVVSRSNLVAMSMIALKTPIKIAQWVSESDCSALDASVKSGDVEARNRTLLIMVGGDQATFDSMVPILNALGKPVLCGAAVDGQTIKNCNQVLVAVMLVSMPEALVLGTKAGVERDFTSGFKSKPYFRYPSIIAETLDDLGVELPGAKLAGHKWPR